MKRRDAIVRWPDFAIEAKVHPGFAEEINCQLHTRCFSCRLEDKARERRWRDIVRHLLPMAR